MKNILFILLFAPCLIFGQEKDSLPVQEEFITHDLSIGKLADYGETSVKFIKVISDSRCPKNVTCIWAGEAKVLLGYFKNGVLLNEKEIVVGGIEERFPMLKNENIVLKILSLRPYPDAKNSIKPEEYVLAFSMRKIPEGEKQ